MFDSLIVGLPIVPCMEHLCRYLTSFFVCLFCLIFGLFNSLFLEVNSEFEHSIIAGYDKIM